MSTYIDSSTSVGLVLSGTPQNPVTIGSSGTIAVGGTATAHNGDAIYGSSITAWTVTNYGTVKATATASTGIDLIAGGTVTNAVGALIAGAADGIRLAGSADLVTNAGAITATSGAGVYLAAGGRVSNLLGGVISGMQDGVVVAGGATATVSNLGKIAAYGTVGIVDGVYIGAGTVVNGASNTTSALISSTLYGIVVAGTAGAVSNFGTVRGTGTAGVGIYLQNGGSVSNAQGALISGVHAGILMKAAGTVSNFGTVAGTGTTGYIDGVYMIAGAVVNGATNVTTALISGVKYGVVMYGSAASTVGNFGTIAGGGTATPAAGVHPIGVYIRGRGTVVNGATNATSALISGVNYAIKMAGSAFGTVTNFGTIASTAAENTITYLYPDGIYMNGAGVVVNGAANARAALISGGHRGIYIGGSAATTVTNFGTVKGLGTSGSGIYVSAGAGVSVISNSGTVIATGTSGDGVDLFAANVSVSNAQGGLISGAAEGIFINGGGTVTNSGTVMGLGTKSSGVFLAPSAGAASVSNGQGGMISGGYHGVTIYGPGRVSNLGTITGSYGVYMQSGTVVNQASGAVSGLISGVASGVVIDGTAGASVSNAGRIQGTAIDSNGIRLKASAASVVNAPAAQIAGDANGILIYGSSTVTNSGTVQGSGTYGAGVALAAAAGGVIVNNAVGGLILGAFEGVLIYGSGTVTNSGVIRGNGSNGAGLYVAATAGIAVIANSGTIQGLGTNGNGIDLLAAGARVSNAAGALIAGGNLGMSIKGAGTVANLGTITGVTSVYMQRGTVVNGATNVTSAAISGVTTGIMIYGSAGSGFVTNYGRIVATAAGGVGVDLSSGTVTNFGVVTAGTNGTGIYLHSGDVTNFGTVIAPGASGTAVVVRYGTFFNYGVITGSVEGIEVSPGTSGTNRGTVSVAGRVSGATGISVVPSATISQTVTVSGTVSSTAGTAGMAVSLGGGGNRLVLQPGAAFEGRVDGGGGTSVLEIAPPSGLGAGGAAGLALAAAAGATYVSLGDFTNFSVLQIDPTMVAQSAGALSFATLVNQGQVNVLSGDALTLGTVAGAASVGVIDLGTAATVQFAGPVASQSVLFNPAGGTALIDHPEQFSGTVTSFAGLDTLDLDKGKASFVGYGGGQLSLSYGGTIIKLAVATPYAAPQFVFGGDGGVGTAITVHDTIITGGIVLSAPASPNPYSIASGIYVTNTGAAHGGDAVYGTPGTAWTLSNAGVIKASAGGSIGVALPGGGTVINNGTVTGSGGTAVRFGGGADRLIVGPGAAFIGAAGAPGIVDGGPGADEADFTAAGTDNLAGFQGFETIALAGGGANVLVMLSGNFTGVTGNRITVVGGSAGNTIRAASLPASDSVVLDGGAGSDVFVFSPASLTASDIVAGVGGTDQLVMTGSGTLNVGGVRAVELYLLASTGANTLNLANANFTNVNGAAITVAGGSAGNTIDASGVSAPNRVVLVGGAGADHFAGGAGNDTFKFTALTLTAADTVAGGGGNDSLSLTTSGTLNVGGVNGIETYALASGGANTLSLSDGNFAGVAGNTITVTGGGAGNTINAAALSPSNSVVLDGGAGSDVFIFSAASLTASDVVAGVGGSDTLMLTTSGTLNLIGVRAVESFTLAGTAANSLTLANANFTNVTAGTITINGGNAGNTINAAGLTGANRIVVHAGSGVDALTGGAGSDVFFAGGHTTMSGGGGTNQFTFAAAGNNAIAQFATSATNRIAFSNAGFALGLGGASATPQALPAGLIGNLTTGAFTAPAQRFAYNQSTGQLLYDAGGGNTPGATQLVATLSGDPALTAPHLFFVT